MKAIKLKTHELEKCYAVAPLRYQGSDHILVAAEKQNKCLLFDTDGNLEDTVWEGPGGTMSMVQVPGSDGVFLATHKFYSPNDSKEAKIVLVTPGAAGGWDVRTLAELPFVHRFDILTAGGKYYLIACALKSGHEYKDDWSMPGKIWAAELPEDLSGVDGEHPLSLTCIKEGLLKNHGYCRVCDGDGEWALVSADNGIFRVMPPASAGGQWRVETLTEDAASDAVFVDFDGDGEREILAITPFHGDTVKIYKKRENGYEPVYTYGFPMEFAHAIWGGTVEGIPLAFIGHRKGKRDLLALYYDRESGTYAGKVLDHDVGPANVLCYRKEGRYYLAAANRETDEIAFYAIESD
ncbi:MAG TPA: hypothetical protein DF613_07065 [Lachnospiraceae bacterium]|nr:hypothetical protein [Lachnospiraceae bacterium]